MIYPILIWSKPITKGSPWYERWLAKKGFLLRRWLQEQNSEIE